jgi:II/X family phage/plasmid replication protein
MTKNLINIDWIHVSVAVKHDPQLISRGIVVHLDNQWNMATAVHHYKAQTLRSSFENTLWIKPSTTGSIEISGNFYKFLNHHNVTGTNDLVGLVTDLIQHLATLEIGIQPTEEELKDIQDGKFRLFRVDVNKAILFESKVAALDYLEHLKSTASYPYRKKTIYSNGVYFGMRSKRWCLKFYHKGTEVRVHKNGEYHLDDEIKALADLMVRAEMRINSQQLKEWDLQFGYQWSTDIAQSLLDTTLNKLALPTKPVVVEEPKFESSADRKFYKCWLDGDAEICYSLRTIQRYTKRFLHEYGINITKSTTI